MKIVIEEKCLQDLKSGDVFQFDGHKAHYMVCDTDKEFTSNAEKNKIKDEKTNVVNISSGYTHWAVNEAIVCPCPKAVFLPHGETKGEKQ